VDHHTFLLTSLSAIFCQQIVFVPLLLIKLLSSIKTVVPIAVNNSLRTRTGEEWKVPKWKKGGMHQKRLETTDLDIDNRNYLDRQLCANFWQCWIMFLLKVSFYPYTCYLLSKNLGAEQLLSVYWNWLPTHATCELGWCALFATRSFFILVKSFWNLIYCTRYGIKPHAWKT